MNRNVLCTSNPIESELHRQAYEYAKKISEHLLPRTRGYLDMWVDGKKVQSSDDFLQEGEPILGKTYLPRKFKTAVVIPPLNDVDCYGNDLDFVAVSDGNGQLAGFNVLAGGGLSTEHGNGNTKTYPNISLELGFVPPEHALKAAEAVVTTQRNFGNRSHRKTTAPATPFKIWAWTTSARKSNAVWVCRSNPYGRSSLPGAATASAG